MRADRLISLLMLLQARGRLSAPALARELGVSERTIYRDIEALTASGLPIYGVAGPTGGYTLVDSYRTTLTGLTTAEARALLLLYVPAPLESLGVSAELRSGLRKLAAALPTMAQEGEQVHRRIHFDANWWTEGDDPAPHVRLIYAAVLADQIITIRYKLPGGRDTEQVVEPLGLVAKAGVWYLIYSRQGIVQARRVSQLSNVHISDRCFVRPPDFDLATFWRSWCAEEQWRRQIYRATVRVTPRALNVLAAHVGADAARQPATSQLPDSEGWLTVDLQFESLEAARAGILACGGGVEVLSPEPLRRSVWDYAEQIVGRYS